MASGNTNTNNSANVKEQLLVCWLEPQSDAGKVSAIPASWIVSTVSGDGRSPESIVRCRWPRTKRLYRATIVSSADQPPGKSSSDDDDNETSGGGEVDSEQQVVLEKSGANGEDEGTSTAPIGEQTNASSAIMVKEEPKPVSTRNSHHQPSMNQAYNTTTTTSSGAAANVMSGTSSQPPSAPSTSSDAVALAQVLLPTLKKLFNSELSKLSADIQANFDIIGHKISALDGTVKCIKTRVDRMETLLNTAAQELGDSQSLAGSATAAAPHMNNSLNNARSSPMNSADLLLTGAARSSLTFPNINNHHGQYSGGTSSAGFNQHHGSSNNNRSVSNNNSVTTTSSRTAAVASSNNISFARTTGAAGIISGSSGRSSNTSQTQQRRQTTSASRSRLTGKNVANQYSQPAVANRRQQSSLASLSYTRLQPLPSMVSTTSAAARPPQMSSVVVPSLKRRRTAQVGNQPLPKAVVVTAPNGIDIYLGGDRNYKMPLVMYKDALKNCTRPVPTYMVMALIRRYLTPDEMSRTWLTEQQLLGKKDGMLLDQNLLNALKNQAVMQFPGAGIDDRLLVRKLYDVFHGIRRQMRKKRRAAGHIDFGRSGLAGSSYGHNNTASAGLLGVENNDEDSGGSGIDHDDGATDGDAPHQANHHFDGYDNDSAGKFDMGAGGYGQEHKFDPSGGDNHLQPEADADGNGDGLGAAGDAGLLNGDEDLEEMAARQAAFWAGADDDF